ncbi:MAG: Ig-like domain-containing protein, partial [Chloroflexota bacterium]|nr:Ig-like domain-containing protein [Chloroflexota bacterium]
YYKSTANTGTHVGHLWSGTGTLLATATFSGESGSGWQEVTFGSPIAITANTTYVASYHTDTGHYSVNQHYFDAGAVDSPPLQALKDGTDGPNGVYLYGAGGAFPTQTFAASNYWVDVVFESSVPADTTPPTITSTSPVANATAVAVGSNVSATFSEQVTGVSGATFELRDSSSTVVPASVSYDATTRRAILDPSTNLATSAAYTARIVADGTIKDGANNALAADRVWMFTTAAPAPPPPPPPDQGPGGPILVIGNGANPFTRFYAEILRNEGLNAFTVTDISNVTPTILANYDVAILGEMQLSAAQETTLSDWVTAGGNLIAMRPDKGLAAFVGLSDAGGTLSNAYLQVDTSSGPGRGIVSQTIQFHGGADRYNLLGATSVATLYSAANTATANPAVTLRSVGSNGGQVAVFAYDLARSIVYTRQGNPAWAGDKRDGELGPIRSDDLFFGAKIGDVQADWVDLNKVQIPQADEQQRLLANLIEQMNLDKKPLPRFWYFPRGEKAVVVMTGDDHTSGGTSGQFDWASSVSPTGCSVADWECVRGTSYMYPGTPLTDGAAAAYEAAGFEVSLHLNTNCDNWTESTLEAFYTDQLAQLAAEFPSISPPTTHRTHCIAWSDWATQPKVELNHGIRLDANYYYWPAAWIQDRPGYFTGSGMPMRFADLDGTLIDVYQAATQMTDESSITYSTHINTLLDNAIGAPGYYGVVTANMHTDAGNHPGQRAIVNAALARSVPVVSARQMLNWLDGRNGSSFGSMSWAGNTLSFTVAAAAGSNGLQAMVPVTSSVGGLTGITRNGGPVTYATQTIKGIEYAFFGAAAGSYEATYAVDQTAPTITGVLAVPDSNGSATITWTTNEAADSRVDYGTSAAQLTSNVANSGLVTAHSIQLTGLAANTTYHFRVTSADAAANSATSPGPPAAAATFSTPSAALIDTSVADFAAGSTGSSTYIGDATGGEVTLAPTVGTEFSGTTLPIGWSSAPWGTGGAVTVSGGQATVDGTLLATTGSYGPGRSIEFAATFGAANFQHAGFGQMLASESGESWAMFSTFNDSSQLWARTNSNGTVAYKALTGSLVGSPHRYRIDWGASSVVFSVDGTVVHTEPVVIAADMRPIASDFASGGVNLSVDWMRMSPFSSSGTFTSRVLDAGAATNWGALSYVANVPSGTTVSLGVRRGDTSTPDGTWSLFSAVSNGGLVGGNSRYLQYQATMNTSAADSSPTLQSVTVGYSSVADSQPPTIVSRSPVLNGTNVAVGSNITATFDEPMDPATMTTASFRLRAEGAAADVPASVTYSSATQTTTLDPTANLAAHTTYTATVASSVADESNNLLGTDASWTFTTGAPTATFTDTTVADFAAGASTSTFISETSDGELILQPTVGAEFSGTSLPAGWTQKPDPWGPGGAATVGGGAISVDATMAGTAATFGPGKSLEFVATFSGQAFQHVGFVTDLDFNAPWVIVSTGSSGSAVVARSSTDPGGTVLGTDLLGSSHRYRIGWTATGFDFYVDGVFKTTLSFATSGAMLAGASDATLGTPLIVDWVRLSPYAGSGTFESRVFDGGASSDWTTLTSSTTTPGASAIAIETRTGGVASPDASWSVWAAVSGSVIASANGRYIQYRANLTTPDASLTPALEAVTLSGGEVPPNRAPTAVADTFTTDRDTALVVPATGTGSPAANDTDPDSDTLTVSAVAGPTGGTVSLVGGSITFTPTPGLCGPGAGSFGYTVSDGNGGTASGTVTVDIVCANREPTFNQNLPDRSSAEGSLISLSAAATDPDGDALTYAASGL